MSSDLYNLQIQTQWVYFTGDNKKYFDTSIDVTFQMLLEPFSIEMTSLNPSYHHPPRLSWAQNLTDCRYKTGGPSSAPPSSDPPACEL
jgi:hypothetical protein